MNFFKRIKNQKGFTLLESLLATSILAFGVLGAMIVTQNASINSVDSDYTTIATNLANEKIEEILAIKSMQEEGFEYIDEANFSSETLSGVFAPFTRTVSVVEVSASDLSTEEEDSGLKKVTVTVTWDNNKTVSLITLLANYS